MLEELGNAQKVRVASLVQPTVRLKPASKARTGGNARCLSVASMQLGTNTSGVVLEQPFLVAMIVPATERRTLTESKKFVLLGTYDLVVNTCLCLVVTAEAEQMAHPSRQVAKEAKLTPYDRVTGEATRRLRARAPGLCRALSASLL